MVSNSPMGLDFLKPTGHLTLNGSMLDAAAWEILSRPEEWNSPACRRDWQGLVDNSDNLNLIYQSPDWFGHLQQTEGERRLALAVCRDKSGRTIAVAPLRIARFPFRFQGRPQGDMVNCASRLVKIGRSHRVHMPGRSTGFWARRLSDPEPAERGQHSRRPPLAGSRRRPQPLDVLRTATYYGEQVVLDKFPWSKPLFFRLSGVQSVHCFLLGVIFSLRIRCGSMEREAAGP